jgi:hypothetical protein
VWLLSILLSACITPPKPDSALSSIDQQILIASQKILTAQSKLYQAGAVEQSRIGRNKGSPPLPVQQQPVQISIHDALDKFVPKDYTVITDQDIDTSRLIIYDANQSWLEAFGKSFAAIGVELNANLYRKQMGIRPFQTNLLEIVDSYIPTSYEVFINSEIDTNVEVRYDASQHWIDALSTEANQAGIDVTANITKKLVFIKPSNSFSPIKKSQTGSSHSDEKGISPVDSPSKK